MPKKIKKIDTPDLDQKLTSALLGQAIKARRTQSELGIEDAAAFCGVAKQTFMKIEHGQETVLFKQVLKICSALGIKLSIVQWSSDDANDWR